MDSLPPTAAIARSFCRRGLRGAWVLLLALGPLAAQTELEKAAEEFRVQTRELGLRSDSPVKAGAAASAAPKYHGRIFENFRNDYLDAIPHQISQRGGRKSVLRRNQFGFNVSGPLILPKLYNGGRKTFLSFSYEGVRDHTARSFLQTLPTLPERLGDFSAVVDQAGALLPIFDPNSTRANPAFNPGQPVSKTNLEYNREPFPENRIGSDRISGVASGVMAYYPSPNAAVGPFYRNNYFLVTPETNNADGFILNLDHTIRARHRITVNFNYFQGMTGSAAMLPTAADPSSSDSVFFNPWGTIEYKFTKSPQTVNTFSHFLETYQSTSGEQGEPDYAGKMGLPGSSPLAFPTFAFSPYVSMGHSNPQSRWIANHFNYRDTLTHKRGKHSLRLTAAMNYTQYHVFSAAYPAGYFRFDEGLTSLPGIVGTGHSYASFLLGLAGYAEKSYVVSPSYFRGLYKSASVQDQYQALKGLTITLGVSVYAQRPRIEKHNRQSSVDLTSVNPANGRLGAMIVTGVNGAGRTLEPSRVNVDPSASLAWNIPKDPKTVLRASYSLYHTTYLSSSTFATQAFNAQPVYLSSNTQLQPAIRLSDGLPPYGHPLPDLRADALNGTNADTVYRGSTRPVYQSASLSIERQFPLSTMVTLAASATQGRDTYVGNSVANLNAIPLSALAYRDQLYDEAFNRSLRPYPQYKSLNVGGVYPLGRYRNESLAVTVEKRATAGLSLSFKYTWAKRRDDYTNGRQDYLNRRNEWSLSSSTPHAISLTYIYELPIGRGKAMLRYTDWRRHLVDGWSLSGTTTYSSGSPLFLRPQFNNTGGVVPNLRVNVVPGVNPQVSEPGPGRWFNPAAFDQPASFTLGNASRSHPSLRGPASQGHDLSASKRFPLAGEKTLEFNAVALNFLNHANWNWPDTVIGPLAAPNVNAGKTIGSTGGRVLQLGLKLSF